MVYRLAGIAASIVALGMGYVLIDQVVDPKWTGLALVLTFAGGGGLMSCFTTK